MGKLRLLEPNVTFINSSGQILVEVLVALAVIVVIVTTVTVTTTTSLANVEFSKTQNQATQYAQEGMETVRSIRNAQISTFNALNGSYCLPENSGTLIAGTNCIVNVKNTFKRSVVLQKNNTTVCAGGTKATVTVTWTDGKCSTGSFCHQAKVSSCIAITNALGL